MPEELQPRLVDARAFARSDIKPWSVVVARASAISSALQNLQDGSPGADGRRELIVAHPASPEDAPGLAPAVEVRFGTLLPSEETRPVRTNATSFAMVIEGELEAVIGSERLNLAHRDSWTTPAMRTHRLRNTRQAATKYVTFSNAPYLSRLDALYIEYDHIDTEGSATKLAAAFSDHVRRAKDVAGPAVPLGAGMGHLLPYEHLIDPEAVPNPPLRWPWEELAPHLGLVRNLGKNYNGRPLWALYNPATERRNGTTSSFFATVTSAPPNVVGPVHRHMSSAINYILDGDGWSIVDGVRVEWAAGDIMLSAPGWAPHGHALGAEGAVILTVQDHPLHIATESLIWQEDVKGGPVLTLGAEAGFQTNLEEARQ